MSLSANSKESIKHLTDKEKREISQLLEIYKYRWTLHARDKQILPAGDWQTWLVLAGRGFGKTRIGAETVRKWKDDNPIIHLVGRTAGDVRDIMIEGESGILNISPPWDRPHYEPSKRRLTWSNGAKALLFTADEPDMLRGVQCYKAWADELASWKYPEAWDQLQFGLRLGDKPQTVVTTTPRPTKIIKELAKDETTHITRGSSYENKANLAPAFYDKIIKKYEGTRLGRQELEAEILEDIEGALWTLKMIDKNRVNRANILKRTVVAIDPAVTATEDSDETGIVVVGLGEDEVGYVLADYSGVFSPKKWAEKAVWAYHHHQADRIVAEVNNGGDLVETNIRGIDNSVSYSPVWSYKGKYLRAEPVSSLYEQDRVKHVGVHDKLEDEQTTWVQGDKSPNRLDALVFGITDLMLKGSDTNFWA